MKRKQAIFAIWTRWNQQIIYFLLFLNFFLVGSLKNSYLPTSRSNCQIMWMNTFQEVFNPLYLSLTRSNISNHRFLFYYFDRLTYMYTLYKGLINDEGTQQNVLYLLCIRLPKYKKQGSEFEPPIMQKMFTQPWRHLFSLWSRVPSFLSRCSEIVKTFA